MNKVKTASHALTIVLVFVFLISPATTRIGFLQGTADAGMRDGFTAEGAAAERRWEELFRTVPAPGSAREHLRRLTAEPHVAGTKEDYATAVYVRDQMRSYGLPAEIKEYQERLPYTKMLSVDEYDAQMHDRLTDMETV